MKFIRFLLPRLEYVLLITLFWSVASNGPKLLNLDGDLPRHLLVGRLIRETKSVPLTDTFSFRTAGFPSIPHEWLSQVVFSLSNDILGLSGVIVLTALIITLAWALVYAEASRRSRNLFITLLITVVGISVSMIHVLPRPHIFTYLFTAIWIILLERIHGGKPQLWWWLPIVMVIWVNMHGMFVLGMILWGIYFVGSLLDNPLRGWLTGPSTRSMVLAGLLSMLATFLSPSGFKIWETIAALGSNSYITSRIPEYQSANFHMPETWPFILLLALTIIGFARTNRSSWTPILLIASFAGIALYTSRMLPLFAIVAVPIASKSLSDWINEEFSGNRFLLIEKNIATINQSSDGRVWIVLAILTITFISYSGRAIDIQGKGNHFDGKFFPVEAVTWLNSHPQDGHMFNEFDWGGYLLLKLSPWQPIFMDGHTHIYGEALTREYESVVTQAGNWQDIFDKYQIQWAIVRAGSPLVDQLQQNGWKGIYEDETAMILRKP